MTPQESAAEMVRTGETRPIKAEPRSAVQWGPIGRDVYERNYSRLKPDGTRETWEDTVERVVDGNLAFVQEKHREPDEREKLHRFLLGMDMIPGGRHLWVTGIPGRQFVSNCHCAGFTRKSLTEHFVFTFDELMKGGGVGSNYSNRYVDMYPPIFSAVDLHVVVNPSHPNRHEFEGMLSKKFSHISRDRFVVEDSREGWCAALAEMLIAAWHGRETPLVMDVSMVRERGAQLRSFGGTSSGPYPLVEMVTEIAALLNARMGRKLSSLDMMEIDHSISKCVVSGNVRRSARMSIKHWADRDILDFVHCKVDHESHWSTNISVEVDEEFFRAVRRGDAAAKAVLHEVATGMRRDGEPGFWNSTLSSEGELERPFATNPCLAYDTPMVTKDGLVPIGKWAEDGGSRMVWDGSKWVRAVAFKTGVRHTVLVRFSNGASIRMTEDHKLGMADGGAVAAGDSEGEAVEFMSQPAVDLGELKPGLVMAGFVQGDGTFHGASGRWKYVHMGAKDKDVVTYFVENGVRIVNGPGSGSDRADRYVIDRREADLFSTWLLPISLKDRKLSAEVVQLPPDEARSFLRGLYSANGSVLEKYKRVTLKTVNNQLALQVQAMLALFGIRSYVTTNQAHDVMFSNGVYTCRESYDLNVASAGDIKRFRETVGFIQAYKTEALDRVVEHMKPGHRHKITVVSVEDGPEEEVFDFTMDETHWASVSGMRVANCGEVPFGSWDVCCLGHVNLERFADRDADAKEAFRLMARFLVRATFGDIINPLQREVIARNRRIGVGFFGYHPWLCYQGVRFSESHHNQEIRRKLREFYEVCRKEARRYAFKLRIPEPIKVTALAPTGTISNLPGVSSGCQPVFAKYFKRRVRYGSNDENLARLVERGYPVEDAVNEPNHKVVTFWCKDPLVAGCEARGVDPEVVEEQREISLSDHLATQAMLQQEYADNAISYTINFDREKVSVEDIERALVTHLPHLKGTTLMPEGDIRPQMPFERISREEFEKAERDGLGRVSDAERNCANGSCPVK